MNTYLRYTESDPSRDRKLGHLDAVNSPKQLTTEFELDEPSWNEVREVFNLSPSASAPDPSRVPNNIHKRCPSFLQLLRNILKGIWQRERGADQWIFAKGVDPQGRKLLRDRSI